MIKRIKPNNFQGPRAYFTDFDFKIVRFKNNKEIYRKEVERRLKIMLLTKNTIVCAASHLTHKFAYNLFKDNPILLTKNMILPALRTDIGHITEYFDLKIPGKYSFTQNLGIDNDLRNNMKDFYKDHVNKVVDWNLEETTTLFRENLVRTLKNGNLVVKGNIKNLNKEKLYFFINEIDKKDILTREYILKIISKWPLKEQKTILNFINLVYHLSGAKVVNCESALPQENYIDYSISDFSKHRMVLSDTQVFLKIFFELSFEILNRNTLPVELIDNLSFNDIYYLRIPLKNSLFQRKYDKMIRKSLKIIKNTKYVSDVLSYDIKEPLEILVDLVRTFEAVFKHESIEFMKRKQKEAIKDLRKSTLLLGYNVLEFFPGFSYFTNLLNLSSTSREVFNNINQVFKSKKEMSDYNLYLKNKEKILHKMIQKYSISERSTFLDALDLITKTIFGKISVI